MAANGIPLDSRPSDEQAAALLHGQELSPPDASYCDAIVALPALVDRANGLILYTWPVVKWQRRVTARRRIVLMSEETFTYTTHFGFCSNGFTREGRIRLKLRFQFRRGRRQYGLQRGNTIGFYLSHVSLFFRTENLKKRRSYNARTLGRGYIDDRRQYFGMRLFKGRIAMGNGRQERQRSRRRRRSPGLF